MVLEMLGVSLSQDALSRLKLYKYGSIDRSPITKYIMKPYWDWWITLFPMWMAPNLITLIGFSFIFINVFTVLYMAPDLLPTPHNWMYYTFALGLHLYQTFDNVDGRQARRTGSSSPLGELFDHGCDALNCCFGVIVQAAAMGTGNSVYTAIMPFLTMAPFYLSTWEEYHTGVLQLGFINGPTEGILAATAVLFLSGVFGAGFWLQPLIMSLPAIAPYFPAQTTLADILLIGMTLLVVFVQFPQSTLTVYFHCKKEKRSFMHAIAGLIPNLFFFIIFYGWLSAPDSTVLYNHLVPFILATGICFGRTVTKIITAYVTKSRFPYFTVQLLPLAFGAINANLPRFGMEPIMPFEYEGTYLWACAAINAFAYLTWAHVIIDSFCKELKIRAFSIPPVKKN